MHVLSVFSFPFPFAQQSDRKSGMSFYQWDSVLMSAQTRGESTNAACNERRSIGSRRLRKMERALALFHSSVEPGAQDVDVAVVGHLEVVDASHNGREELIRSVGCLCRFADDGEHGRESLEACEIMLVSVVVMRSRTVETYHRWATWDCP